MRPLPFKKKFWDKKEVKKAKHYLNILFQVKENNIDVWKPPIIGYIMKSLVILMLHREVTADQAHGIINFLGNENQNKMEERYT